MTTDVQALNASRGSYRSSLKLTDDVDLSDPVVIQRELQRLKRKRRREAKTDDEIKYFTCEIEKLTHKLSAFENPDFKYRTGEGSGLGIIHKTGRSRAGRPNIGRPKGPSKTPLDKTVTRATYLANCLASMLRGSSDTPELFVKLSVNWNQRDDLLNLLENLPRKLLLSQTKIISRC